MTKEHDPYQPCPCDSGKKFKFCCYKLRSEIDRVQRMLAGEQLKLAEQTLEKLATRHPDNLWVRITRATLALSDSRYDEAVAECDEVLSRMPDHPAALLVRAMAHVRSLGYARTRTEVQKALQKGALKTPRYATLLANIVAEQLVNQPLAHRAHLELALALSIASTSLGEESSQTVSLEARGRLIELLERFEQDEQIPLCLRWPWRLESLPEQVAAQREAVAAKKLLDVGCFEAAGRLFEELAEQFSDEARLWFNAGLSFAWGARDKKAVEALRRAAQLADDFETAAEWETLAQMIAWSQTERTAEASMVFLDVSSAEEALRRLSEAKNCLAGRISDAARGPEGLKVAYAAWLDRALSDKWMSDFDSDPQEVPEILANLVIVERGSQGGDLDDSNGFHWVVVRAEPGVEAEKIFADIRAVLGDVVTKTVKERKEKVDFVPQQFAPLIYPPVFMSKEWHPVALRKVRQRGDYFVEQVWLKTPQDELGGVTPEEASGREDLRVALAAAVNVLDDFCLMAHYFLDVDQLRQRLQLPPRAAFELPTDRSLAQLNAFQLRRLKLEPADGEKLKTAFRRIGAFADPRVRARLCEAVLKQNLFTPPERELVQRHLLDCYVQIGDREKARQLLHEVRQHAGQIQWQDQAEYRVRWDSLAAVVMDRLRDKEELKKALLNLWQHHKKIPELEEFVVSTARRNRISGPWDDEKDQTTGMTGRETESGIWVPTGSQEDEPKKLWLPGQD